MPLLSNDEECAEGMDDVKSCKVEVSAVEDVAGVEFISNPVHCLGAMLLGRSDAVDHGYFYLGVDADAGLGTAKVRPSEERLAEVDCCESTA